MRDSHRKRKVFRVESHDIMGSSKVNLLETHPWFNRFTLGKHFKRFRDSHERIAERDQEGFTQDAVKSTQRFYKRYARILIYGDEIFNLEMIYKGNLRKFAKI